MRKVIFYSRIISCGLWFLISSLLVLILVPFRWKDQNLGAFFSRILNWGSSKILNVSIIVHNESKLYTSQPCIYVVNHQSNWDIFTTSRAFPYRSVVIGKKEIQWLPVFGLLFVGSGNILINRDDRIHALSGLEKAKNEILSKQVSVWIFPEGTRNYGSKKLLPFKKGAFHLAISAQVPIVPIIQQSIDTFYEPKKYRLGDAKLHIIVLDPIPTAGMTTSDLPKLMADVREKMEKGIEEVKSLKD